MYEMITRRSKYQKDFYFRSTMFQVQDHLEFRTQDRLGPFKIGPAHS